MILISNTKTMIKLYISIAVVAVLSIVGIYYYFNTMTTVNGALNINKIKNVDKTYSRSVYSDFYFRAIGYPKSFETNKGTLSSLTEGVSTLWGSISSDEKVINIKQDAYYSSLLPQKISLGYDFKDSKDPKFIMQGKNISEGRIRDQSGDVAKYSTYLDLMEKFSTTFGYIVASQDQDYFDDVYNDTKNTFKELYGVDVNVSKIKQSSFYNEVPVKINNMKINYYKLAHFKLSNFLKTKEWKPHIAYWSWGDSEIYLQLLGRANKVDLKKLDELSDKAMGDVVVKTIKINNNHVDKLTLVFTGNDVKTVLLSNDGYLYLLKMRNSSLSSLKTGIDDFLKIAYGIYFRDNATDTWFFNKQKEITGFFNQSLALEKEIVVLKKDLASTDIDMHQYPERWDQKFLAFKKYYGVFPNQEILSKLNKEKNRLAKEKENTSMWKDIKKASQKMLN